MIRFSGHSILLGLSLTLAGCAGVPEMPPEAILPIKDITNEAICQIRDAYVALAPDGKDAYLDPDDKKSSHGIEFDAENWAIGITIIPKTTNDVTVGVNASGTTNPTTRDPHLPTIAVSPSGISGERIADSSGTVVLETHSSIFYPAKIRTEVEAARNLQTRCDRRPEFDQRSNQFNFIALSSDLGDHPNNSDDILKNSLGIYYWLRRILETADSREKVISLISASGATNAASLSNDAVFTYTTHISLEMGGSASGTWTPPGVALHFLGLAPSFSGKKTFDVSLELSFVHDTHKASPGKPGPEARATLRKNASQLQLIQAIQQLTR